MLKRFFIIGLVSVVVFMFCVVPVCLAESEPVQTLYVIPFNKGVAPEYATIAIFDAMVDHLYGLGEQRDIRVTIVKQELTDADADWFAGKHYLIGEVSEYIADKGCCYTEIKLTGQTQLHLPGGEKQPILELSDEAFFNHDITPPQQAQSELFIRLGEKMAEQLLLQIDTN